MSAVQEVLHWVNLFLFALCVPVYGWCLYELHQCNKPRPVKIVAAFISVCAVFLSVLYVALQVNWDGLGTYKGVLPPAASPYWLVFDYLIASYMLCVAAVVRVYCGWRGRMRNTRPNPFPPNRRWTDAAP